jgi:hypothetical protein
MFLAGVWALRDGFARWISGALGVWIAGITLFARDVPAITYWNNIVVGVGVLLLSCVGVAALDAARHRTS